MANQWFRLYSEFSHDAKVQTMSESMQRRYIMIMCLRCSNDIVTLHETEIAFYLRITNEELAETKKLFIAKKFIDDEWNLINWDKRQFNSDSSTERVTRHREKKKRKCNGDVTLQKRKCNVLDTDTDTEQNRTDLISTDVDIIKTPDKKNIKKENSNGSEKLLAEFGIIDELATDFVLHRKSKKAPITKTALNGFQREAEKSGISILEAVRISIERGWTGYKAEWHKEKIKTHEDKRHEREVNYNKELWSTEF